MRAVFSRKVFALLLGFVFVAPLLYAAEPMDQIQETTDKILSILKNPEFKSPEKTAERKKMIRAAVDRRFDWTEMSRRTLGRHWARLKPEQKNEFMKLFSNLLERTYLDQVQDYSGLNVLYEGQKTEGKYASVNVKIQTKEAREIPVVYRMLKDDGDWYVYDVLIEGVSLINNYRSQFNSILVNSSFETLIERLRTKVSEG